MKKLFSNKREKDPGKGETPSEQIPETPNPSQHDADTSDGSEFLDDSIRMKEQPFQETPVKENE